MSIKSDLRQYATESEEVDLAITTQSEENPTTPVTEEPQPAGVETNQEEEKKSVKGIESMVEAIELNVAAIKETSPALIDSAILVVNNQLADIEVITGSKLPRLVLDTNTNKITEESLQYVNDTVANLRKAFEYTKPAQEENEPAAV